jgi:hypothetical protein
MTDIDVSNVVRLHPQVPHQPLTRRRVHIDPPLCGVRTRFPDADHLMTKHWIDVTCKRCRGHRTRIARDRGRGW